MIDGIRESATAGSRGYNNNTIIIVIIIIIIIIIIIVITSITVEPLLSGHPWGSALWPLNRGGR